MISTITSRIDSYNKKQNLQFDKSANKQRTLKYFERNQFKKKKEVRFQLAEDEPDIVDNEDELIAPENALSSSFYSENNYSK